VARKLENDAFTAKAPAHVVEKERRRREELAARKHRIVQGLEALG